VLLAEESSPGLLELVRQLRRSGFQVGWLEMASWPEIESLAGPARAGSMRAVLLSPEGSLVFKPRRTLPPLLGLLREHFLGCEVVVLLCTRGCTLCEGLSPRGAVVRAVHLRELSGGWQVGSSVECAPRDGSTWTTDQLVARLRRPYLLAPDPLPAGVGSKPGG
jgi:hypothetical protein